MATIGIDRMYLLAHVLGQGNPETVRVPIGASVTQVSPGTILIGSVTANCATKPSGRAIQQLIGMAEWTNNGTTTVTRGDLMPITVIRPGDMYIGSHLGAVSTLRVGAAVVTNRTDTTNDLYYATLSAVSGTKTTNSAIVYTLAANMNTMKPGAFMLGRSTSNDSSGTLIRTLSNLGVSGDTNPRVIFTWQATIFGSY